MHARVYYSGFMCGMVFGAAIFSKLYADVFRKQEHKIRESARLINYMANLIDEHDVPLTQFDAIAIHAIVEEVKNGPTR